MPRNPRIAIDPCVLRALRAWAAREGKEPDVLASEILRAALPPEVAAFAKLGGDEEMRPAPANLCPPEPERSEPPKHKHPVDSCPLEKKSEPRKIKRSVTKDPVAMERLKEMYASGAKQIEIADALGYNRKTIHGVITALEKKGVLKKNGRSL